MRQYKLSRRRFPIHLNLLSFIGKIYHLRSLSSETANYIFRRTEIYGNYLTLGPQYIVPCYTPSKKDFKTAKGSVAFRNKIAPLL